MGYMPRDRQEEDALDMYRLLDLSGDFLLALGQIVGPECRMHPRMAESVKAIREALDGLEGDAQGLLDRYDPDREMQATARRERAMALLAQAKAILPDRNPDNLTTSRPTLPAQAAE
jgi:hypothetical protein